MGREKQIVSTLAYYDVLSQPLTAFEAHVRLLDPDGAGAGGGRSFDETLQILESLVQRKAIGEQDGFYFLPGKEASVTERIRDDADSTARLKRARRYMKALCFLPFVRMVIVTGSLALKRGRQESDWDVLIVAKAGRIYLARAVTTLFFQFIGKRRHGIRVRDRFCLNHWLAEDALEIEVKDLFAAREYRSAIPMVGWSVFQKFEQVNFSWIKRYEPNATLTTTPSRWVIPENALSQSIRTFFERLLDFDLLERWAGSFQERKIARNPKTALPGSRIAAGEKQLVFLPYPKGPAFLEKFQERMRHFEKTE